MRTTVWLLVAVCAAGSLLWFVELRQRAVSAVGGGELLLPLDARRVSYLAVERGDLFVEFERERGRWMMRKPVVFPADPGRIERIVAVAGGMLREETITPDHLAVRGLTAASYELVAPRARLVMGTDQGRVEMRIGADAPFEDRLYVKLSTEEPIIATTTEILRVLPQTVADCRDRRLFPADPMRITRLDVERRDGGFVQFVASPDGWQLMQPMRGAADAAAVDRLLRALLDVRIDSFLSDGWSDPVAYGLGRDESRAVVGIWTTGEESSIQVHIGRATPDGGAGLFARRSDGDSIFTIPSNTLDTVMFRINDLRDRRLWRLPATDVTLVSFESGERRVALRRTAPLSWTLEEPVHAPADAERVWAAISAIAGLRAKRFIDGAAAEALAPAFENPVFIVGMQGAATAATGVTMQVAAWSEDDETVCVRMTGERLVCEVAMEDMRRAIDHEAFLDPVRFRDRQILALSREHVYGLERVREGLEQRVVRGADGVWVPAEGAVARVRPGAPEAVLAAAANLRALRLAPGTQEREEYGLTTDPAGSLTILLDGAEGIQKTLILGRAASADEVYAALQGTDLVYVIRRELAEFLMAELLE